MRSEERKFEWTCDKDEDGLGDGCMPGRLHSGIARQSENSQRIQPHAEGNTVCAYRPQEHRL